MSHDERERWDRRYAEGAYTPRPAPTGFLLEWLDRIVQYGVVPGEALDVACGTGHNTLALAAAGWTTTGVDVSEVALAQARASAAEQDLDIAWVAADLDGGLPVAGPFDLITVFRFRNPALWAGLCAALNTDGWLVVEHHLQTTREVTGPTSSAFRLEPQELLGAFRTLRIVHYSEQLEHDEATGAFSAVARIVACNGHPGF